MHEYTSMFNVQNIFFLNYPNSSKYEYFKNFKTF